MRRSVLVVLVTVLVGLFMTASPGAAETGANITKPSHEQPITSDSPVPVEVRVDKLSSDPAVESVQVRLFADGSSYSRTSLQCVSGCGSSPQTWTGTFDPRPAPIRNGLWKLQLSLNGGDFQDRIQIYLSLPPSPVKNLQTKPEQGGVQLTWDKAPEPDISGYRVQRSTSDGGWQQVASLGSAASTYKDNVSSGSYMYRVISVRPDGRTGEPLTAASGAKSAEVAAPPPPPQSENKNQNPGAPGPSGNIANNSVNGGTTTGSNAPQPNAGRGALAARVPPPPPARRGFGFNLRSLGQVFGFQSPQGEAAEEAFGEGEGFSEELDYSGVDPVTGEPVDLPLGSSIQEILISQLTNRPLLISLAAGLLLLALAFYILRWLRRSPAPPEAGQDLPASAPSSSALSRFFRIGGRSGTSAGSGASPTAVPLSPRGSTQTLVANPAAVRSPERAATRPPTASPLFDGDGQARPVSRDEARPVSREEPRPGSRDEPRPVSLDEPRPLPPDGVPSLSGEEPRPASRDGARRAGSVLFAQRQPSSPASGGDEFGRGSGAGSVKVLRPESSEENGRKAR